MVTQVNSTATTAPPGPQTQGSAAGASRPPVATTVSAKAQAPVAEEQKAAHEKDTALKVLEAKVSSINVLAQNSQRSIHFSVAEKTGDTIIQVFNAETDELIREIPSKELQKVAEAIEAQLSEGLLFNTSV